MGFLNRLFAGDPHRELERAQALLERGEAERALQLARRAGERASPAGQNRAQALVDQAHAALAAAALEKASLAEASEYFEDAAEWLGIALEHAGDGARRSDLEQLQRSLLKRARQAEAKDVAWEQPPESTADSQTELDSGTHYQALIDMLAEDVAERYETRPPAFRAAYVALNEGRATEAGEALEALATVAGDDAVIRLELGRSRLALGDAARALSDFEAAWPDFGDRPLDLIGELSVPGLWADAMLAVGRPEPVIERLAELADPVAAAPLCERYAQALLAAQRFAEARDFLVFASAKNPARDLFAFQLAEALEHLGERAAAIDHLEAAIAPSCTSGCAPRARHLPSFRALASLYLADGRRPERVHELLTLVAQTQAGRLTHHDHSLLAGYYEQIGDPEAAERARTHARRLGAEAAGLTPST